MNAVPVFKDTLNTRQQACIFMYIPKYNLFFSVYFDQGFRENKIPALILYYFLVELLDPCMTIMCCTLK